MIEHIEHVFEILIAFAVVAIIELILRLISRRNKKLAESIGTGIGIISAGVLILVILFLVLLLLNSRLHFWY